jgi:hypothetical protein
MKTTKDDFITLETNFASVNDIVEFTYHDETRNGKVLEVHESYFKVELDTEEVKNFRYNKVDNGLVKLYN